ncbi:cytochrome P450 [Aspergillus sclerotioniger CBS 115572]|uniref:Cytochrome P450 n=1 Tax=Aspergillus sclerotioniger CBS 115572 TaxID=1450535 RepID=A0A317X254_9EURO|nr:cytochrome P450 [Aspergillus sclerotioniger CBS 115572]PWY90620.1 cytochrome P450 [Aspergillus sclerotioniger CBS 115572]
MSFFDIQLRTAIVTGLLSHWTFFIHGERDLAAASIARFHLIVASLVTFLNWRLGEFPIRDAFRQAVVLVAAYAGALFTSTLLFRMFLSPLNHIDGPLSLRITKLTHVWKQARYRNCEVLHELHQKYGDVVRTGPSEVTVFGTEAFYKVHGKESHCARAAYYDLLHPLVSLDTTRDPVMHAHKRKVWDQAFSVRAMEKLEPVIYRKADLLVKQLQNQKQNPVDISVWLEYYTFDLMGEFGLTIDFKNLERVRPHPILTLYHMAHRSLGPLAAAPWIKHLLMGIPYIERMKYYRQFMDWATAELGRNINVRMIYRTDIIGYVLDDARQTGGIEANWRFVLGDFALVIAAGSDPMRQVLANLLYYLAREPIHLQQIREELGSIDMRDYKALQQSPHLNACIYETLRLNPAVPSSGLRLAPSEGLEVAGKFIPPGTTIAVPQYSLFRDERNFVRPLDWIPERFTSQPDLIRDKQAFMPWSAGKYACIGKNLSLMEIRVAAALILTTFDYEFAPGEDGQRIFSEAADYFTTTPGPFYLVMKNRGAV